MHNNAPELSPDSIAFKAVDDAGAEDMICLCDTNGGRILTWEIEEASKARSSDMRAPVESIVITIRSSGCE